METNKLKIFQPTLKPKNKRLEGDGRKLLDLKLENELVECESRESARSDFSCKFQRSKLQILPSLNYNKHKMTSSRRKVGGQSKINTHTAATPSKATKKQQLTATPSLAPSTISQPSLTPEMSSYQEMPSLTPENVAAILTELKELRATVAQNQNKISILEKQIDYLKGHITITESKLAIAEHVSSTLHEQIDNQEQYSRRKCLIFEGIKVEQKEKDCDLEKRILNVIQRELKLNIEPEDIDKAHRIGPVEGDE